MRVPKIIYVKNTYLQAAYNVDCLLGHLWVNASVLAPKHH